jgi:hypothetical protein
MEMPAKATTLTLLAICFAVGLLITVFIDFTRPQLSRLAAVSGHSSALEDNWFPQRTFNLLSGELPPPKGIDIQRIAERSPFERPIVAAGPSATELVEVKPEPDPPPPPPPPATREISLIYRGLYRASSGEPFVYVEIANTTKMYSINAAVAPGWTIAAANARELVLQQDGGASTPFPFNKKKSLEVPIK